MGGTVFEQSYRVLAHEAEADGLASPLALLDRLQDAAGRDAARLGVAMEDLLREGRTWFLARSRMRIERRPGRWERFTVATWASGREGLYYTREFVFSDDGGAPLALATTDWFVFDLARGRPLRPGVLPPFPCRESRLLRETPLGRIPGIEAAEPGYSVRVRPSDLDINRHVNNALYVQWALDTMPPAFREEFSPFLIEAAYRQAAGAGETVECAVSPPGEDPVPERIHRLARKVDGTELARVRTMWGKRPVPLRAWPAAAR